VAKQKSRKSETTSLYWIPTILIALNWTFGGASSLLKAPTSIEVFHRLGYPDYFATMLGAAQLLGVLAVLAPVPRTLREWAYAGFTFDASAAIISLLAVGSPIPHVLPAAISLPLVLTSYRAWRARMDGPKPQLPVAGAC